VLALVIAAYTALYTRALGYDFVWDDVQEIEHNAAFEGPLADGLATTQTERTDPDLTQLATIRLSYDSYRPLLFASYWMDIRLWGRRAGPLHATNLVLGVLAVLAAYAVARRLCESPAFALVTAALFALHPVQIEAVAYISGRGDLLAGLFALAASYAAMRAGDAGSRTRAAGWMSASATAFAASLLCKEACLGLPVAIAAIAWAAGALRARLWMVLMLLGVAVAYLVLRRLVVVSTTGGALGEALIGLPSIWLEYLQVAILPFDLSIERMHRASLVPVGWVVVAAVALGAAAYRTHRQAPIPPAMRTVVAGLAWFAALSGPPAIAVVSSGVAADRYLYTPWFGLAVALASAGAAALRARPALRRPIIAVAASWGALLIVVAWYQIPVWRDNRALYTHAVEMVPNSSSAQYRVAFLDAQTGNWADAIPRLEHAVELDPHNTRALNNLGVGYLRTRRYPDAEAALARAVEANPAHFRSWLNLGIARLEQGKRDAACTAIARALQINPAYQAARSTRAQSCASH
jgi:tetratricopeptide (TPR) repeat protein